MADYWYDSDDVEWVVHSIADDSDDFNNNYKVDDGDDDNESTESERERRHPMYGHPAMTWQPPNAHPNRAGIVRDGEAAAVAVNAGLPLPAGTVPGSRLSIIFNPNIVQNLLFEFLEREDILNVIQADPYARRMILPSLNDRQRRGYLDLWGYDANRPRAIDYNWRGVNVNNGGPDLNVNPAGPIPASGLCDVEDFPPPRHREEVHSEGPLLPRPHQLLGLPRTAEDHRLFGIQKWFKCRRRGRGEHRNDNNAHRDNRTAHCEECNTDSAFKVLSNYPHFLPVCGLCHFQATRKFPYGWGPQILTGGNINAVFSSDFHIDRRLRQTPWLGPFAPPNGILIRNCECMEDLRYLTCFPCIDRLLDQKIRGSDLERWPRHFDPLLPNNHDEDRHPHRTPFPFRTRNLEDPPLHDSDELILRPIRKTPEGVKKLQYPICPCGREINPVKQPALYPDWLFQVRLGNGEIMSDLLEPRFSNLQRFDWSAVCIDCDGLWVPRTKPYKTPGSQQNTPEYDAYVMPRRVPFKEALGLGGKGENNWRRKPWINMPPDKINDQEEWEVNRILDSRHHYRKVQYQVEWAGQNNDESDDTWYPAENFEHCQDILRIFHIQHPDAPQFDLPPPRKRRRRG